MPSIDQIRASDGSANASVAVIQSSRAPAASTIVVDTVAGINTNFIGSMGTPHTFVDPVTSETITVISEATAVDFKGHVDGGDLEIDTIAPGYTDAGSEVGDIVIIRPTTQWSDAIADVLDVSHDDDGTLKDGSVNAAGVLASNVVTAAKIADDAVFPANLTAGTSGSSWAWVPWTPTFVNWTIGTGGSAGTVAVYTQIGKTILFKIRSTLGSSGQSVGGSVTFTLPVAASSNFTTSDIVGTGSINDQSAGSLFNATAKLGVTNSIAIVFSSADDSGNATAYNRAAVLGANDPFTFAQDDYITFTGFYEAA